MEANIPAMLFTFVLHPDGSFSFPYVNSGSRKLFGLGPQEIMHDGGVLQEIIHPDDRARGDASILKSAETLQPWREELRYIVNGEIRWYDCFSHPERMPNGDIVWDGIILEITKRKRAEAALQESEAKFRRLHESMMDAFVSVDMSGRILDTNRAYQEILGYSAEELRRLTYQDLTPEKWHAHESRIVEEEILIQGYSGIYEKEYRRKDGTVFPIELRTFLIRDEAGSPVVMWAIIRDITRRKRAEEALRASESFLNSIIEQSPHPMWISDAKGTLLRINRACLDILRITADEVVGKYNILQDNIVEEQGLLPQVRNVFEKGKTASFEIKYDTSRLKSLHLQRASFVILDTIVFPIKDGAGRTINAVIQHKDITKRKRAEAALQESAEQYAIITRTSMDGFAVVDLTGKLLDVNEAYCRMLGHGREELLKMSVRDIEVQQTAEDVERQIRKAMEIGSGRLETQHRCKDGSLIDVEVSMSFWKGPGRILVFVRDITERKRAEAALRKNADQYAIITRTSLDGFAVIDLAGKILDVNEAYCRMIGYTRDELLTMSAMDLEADHSSQEVAKHFRVVMETGSDRLESRHRCKDGSLLNMEVSMSLWRGPGRILVFHRDITERKKAEEALQKSAEQYAILTSTSMDGFALHDFAGNLLDVNEAYCRMLGYSRDELLNLSIKDIDAQLTPEEIAGRYQEIDKAGVARFETRHRRKDGSLCDIELSISLWRRTRLILVFLREISERKRAEAALRENAEQYAIITRTSMDGFAVIDLAGKILDVNEAYCRMLGYGRDEFLKKSIGDIDGQKTRQEIEGLTQELTAKGYMLFETRHRRKDGSLCDVEISMSLWRDSDRILVFIRDITERRRAELQIQASLREKETLLQELHHRTKNNMQVIRSMLKLQALSVGDDLASTIFKDLDNRINAMALVHQKLYQSKSLSRVGLKDYLHDLVSLLMDSYKVQPDRIAVALEAENIPVVIDIAIPCGLLVTELLSNAFKHAFPGNRRGEVRIRLDRLPEGDLLLSVSDNGVGMPEGLDLRQRETLGLQMIFAIGEHQLQGKVAFETSAGVSCRIQFKETLYGPRL